MVAPTRTTIRSSTACSSASCCDLREPMDLVDEQDRALARQAEPVAAPLRSPCAARRHRRSPPRPPRSAAWVAAAMMRASDVLPVPAGPYRITEDSASASIAAPQPGALARPLVLTDELVERARAHASGERRRRGTRLVGALVEERAARSAPLSCRAQHLALEERLSTSPRYLPDDVALPVGEDDERRGCDAERLGQLDTPESHSGRWRAPGRR